MIGDFAKSVGDGALDVPNQLTVILSLNHYYYKKSEGAKTSPFRGGFTPSKQSAGRRLLEAQGCFDLCGGRLKAPP